MADIAHIDVGVDVAVAAGDVRVDASVQTDVRRDEPRNEPAAETRRDEPVAQNEPEPKKDEPRVTAPKQDETPVNDPAPPASTSAPLSVHDDHFDEKILSHMGYLQDLFRGFNALMSFSFCFTAVGAIGGISGLFAGAMSTGGPVVLAWSWIVCGIITIVIGMSMAEICSVYPFAGSVYHWAGCTAPPEWSPVASFICGWFNFIGNVAGDAFFANSFANNVAELAVANGGTQWTMGEQVALMIFVILIWGIINYLRVDQQGWLNNACALYQIFVTFIFIFSLLIGCGQQGALASGADVFTSKGYNDGTGWNNPGVVILLGLLTPLYSITGYEAAGHMAEETRQSHKSSPIGIVYCCIVSAVLGFIYVMALCFSAGQNNLDIFYECPGTLTNISDINNTLVQATLNGMGGTTSGVFFYCNGPSYGLALSSMLAIMMFVNGISSLTVTTRITYAMARDGAFPFSARVRFIHPTTKAPLGAVFLTIVVDILLVLMNLATPTSGAAFFAITSIATIGYQMSYAVPIFIRATYMRDTFPKNAPFSLGKYGVGMGWFCSIWLTFTSILFFLPTSMPVTTDTMNWTPVVFGIVCFICIVYWFGGGRHVFKGPKRCDIFSVAAAQ